MLDKPLPTLNAWTEALIEADIPVLPSSVSEVALLSEVEEARSNVDAHMLTQALGGDPLMTLKVISHVSRYCTRLSVEPPETLTGAIVMLGIGPFFSSFGQMRTIDEVLAERPSAWKGLQRTIRRARRSAHLAVHFAMHRQDEDAVVIQQAALLHDFAEMLMWCNHPTLMEQIEQRLAQDHTQRSGVLQKQVLNVTLDELAQSLMHAWQLPDLLIRCTDDRHATDPKVRSVMLAVRVARHTQYGWDTPNALAALPDDAESVAELLNISKDAAMRKIHDLDH